MTFARQPFTVFVIQSAHTDIGYTHPQEQIQVMYSDFYDKVLEFCHHTEHDPLPQRFKWVCETSWQVKVYLTAHPERIEEFVYYVRAGQIEITGAYLHFTDLIDEDAYRRSLNWVADFRTQYELPLRTAMHCDINGWTWALPKLLQERGIPFFLSQVHMESATDPLGALANVHYQWKLEVAEWLKPDAPTRIPQAFWWQAPTGERILHWLGEHYHLGNHLGLSGTHQFSVLKTRFFWETDRDPMEKLYNVALRELPAYIEHLQAQGYPYQSTLISLGGYLVDNAAPDLRWCEIIARWNAEHDDIKLRTATVSEWYDHLLTLDNGTWLTYRTAWPDHWAHGLGSMTQRIGQARGTQRRRADAITLAQHANLPQIDVILEAGLEQERLALEHTFDAWMTTEMPWHSQNDFLASHKELAFQRAELYLDDAIAMSLRALVPLDAEHPKLYRHTVEESAAISTLHFGAGDYRIDETTQELVDQAGRAHPFQRDSHTKDSPRYIATIPAHETGIHGFYLQANRRQKEPAIMGATVLENRGWRVEVDPQTGGLSSLTDTVTKRDWANQNHDCRFGQVVHERVIHPAGRAAISNPSRLVAGGIASEKVKAEIGDYPVFTRLSLQTEGETRFMRGEVFNSISLHGKLADQEVSAGQIGITWRTYHALPLVELVIDWEKEWVELPEATYVTFPFQITNDCLNLETAGGFFQPGSHSPGGQLSGTVSSYYTIQRAAQIESPNGSSLLWLPLEAPLVMLQDLNFINWDRSPYEWNGFLASMPVNHYWHTNFPRSQRGYIRLRYRFMSLSGFADREMAIRAAMPSEALGWR